MTTRQATLDDFSALYLFWQTAGLQLYPETDELKRYESMLNLNPDLCILLINEKQEVIGSIFGAFDGRTASVHRLAILPELQKQGLGKKLIAALEEVLRQKGIKKLSAQIHISNTQVIPFYEKLGFQEMTYVKTYFKDLK
jgi:ribosomal protein S18 acetylase RimI-like enzyme